MPEHHPLATWNPARDLWEDPRPTIFGPSDVYSGTWPTSGGMTSDGVAYQLPEWEPPTSGSACSSSPPVRTFRTPAAAEAEGGPRNPDRPGATMRLSDQVREEHAAGNLRVFKTPTSQLAVNGGSQHPDKRKAGGRGPTLADEVEHLLPTPTAMNPNEDEDLDQWQARRERVKAEKKNGNGFGMPLGIAVRTLPTPGAADGSGGRVSAEMGGTRASGAKRSITLSTAVHHQITTRTGAPTPRPSTGGSPSPAQPLPPWSEDPKAENGCPPGSRSG